MARAPVMRRQSCRGRPPEAFETAASRHLALSVTLWSRPSRSPCRWRSLLVRWHRGWPTSAIAAVNVLRTIPSLALLVVILPVLGTGFLPSVVALTLYGLPAMLINTYTALREVDPDVVEAGARPGHDRSPGHAPHRGAARPAGDLRRHPHRRGADRVGRDARRVHRRRRTRRVDHRRHGARSTLPQLVARRRAVAPARRWRPSSAFAADCEWRVRRSSRGWAA